MLFLVEESTKVYVRLHIYLVRLSTKAMACVKERNYLEFYTQS